MAFMEFINTVGTVLGTAKKFLSVYNAVTEDESDRGFAAPKTSLLFLIQYLQC